MKPSKKRAAKSAAKKPATPQVESIGNMCATNYWIKLGLMREELAALKTIAGVFENSKDQTTGKALHLVVTTALLHWDKLEPHVFSDREYCEAEGFRMMEQFRQAALRGKFPALKPQCHPHLFLGHPKLKELRRPFHA